MDKYKQWQTIRIYVKNPKGKNQPQEGVIMYGNYNEFSRVLSRLQVLGFSGIKSEPLDF